MSRRRSLGHAAEGQNAKQNGDEMMNDVVTNTVVVKNAAHAHSIKLPRSNSESAFARSYFNFALKTPNYTLGRGQIHIGHPQMVGMRSLKKQTG